MLCHTLGVTFSPPAGCHLAGILKSSRGCPNILLVRFAIGWSFLICKGWQGEIITLIACFFVGKDEGCFVRNYWCLSMIRIRVEPVKNSWLEHSISSVEKTSPASWYVHYVVWEVTLNYIISATKYITLCSGFKHVLDVSLHSSSPSVHTCPPCLFYRLTMALMIDNIYRQQRFA